MQTLRNIFKRILAAFIFFTRLPFWRIADVEKQYYERVVPLWPLVGWLTGGVMALVFIGASACRLPIEVCVMLSLVSRVLITGALHEDGFADFCDGFGGGTDRKRTLEIMKDSHIGTYGVLGLVLYFLLIWSLLTELFSRGMSPLVFPAADAACKYFSSTIIYSLPYARKEEDAKNKLVYTRTPISERIVGFVIGLLPMALFLPACWAGLLAVFVCCMVLFWFMRRRIGGYTGDCCGATFIITELIFYLSLCIMLS